MKYVYVAPLMLILFVGSLGSNPATAATSTTVSLDNLSGFPVTQGEPLIFSGRLIKATTLEGIANATIKIMHDISFNDKKVLITGTTNQDGFYSIPWIVDVEKVVPTTGGSFGKGDTQGREKRFQVKVFAEFEGDSENSRSVSNAQAFEVRLNQLKIVLEKKSQYLAFESLAIRVRITDVENRPTDPDTITATFDNSPITLVHEEQGVYSLRISSLPPGPHSLKIIAEKRGHVTDEQLVTIDGMKRRTGLVINTDKSTYQQGETVMITFALRDTAINEFVTNVPISGSITSPNLRVESLVIADGKASYELSEFSPPGRWTITASFAGSNGYFASSNSATFTVERGSVVVEPPRPEEKVTLGTISLVDQMGTRLRSVQAGEQVMIQAQVTSNFDAQEEIAYITQIKDSEGVTVALSWITGTVAPSQTLELAISWLPNNPGEYTAEVFVWKDVRTPEPLSFDVKRATIVVR